jgi:hypothetical protein
MMDEIALVLDEAMDAWSDFERAIEQLAEEAKIPAEGRWGARMGCYGMLALSCKQKTSELSPTVRAVLTRLGELMQNGSVGRPIGCRLH